MINSDPVLLIAGQVQDILPPRGGPFVAVVISNESALLLKVSINSTVQRPVQSTQSYKYVAPNTPNGKVEKVSLDPELYPGSGILTGAASACILSWYSPGEEVPDPLPNQLTPGVAALDGPTLVDITNTTFMGNGILPVPIPGIVRMDTSIWRSVVVMGQVNSGGDDTHGIRLQFLWSDPSLTFTAVDTFDIVSSIFTLQARIPVQGPFLTLQVFGAAGQSFNIALVLFGSNKTSSRKIISPALDSTGGGGLLLYGSETYWMDDGRTINSGGNPLIDNLPLYCGEIDSDWVAYTSNSRVWIDWYTFNGAHKSRQLLYDNSTNATGVGSSTRSRITVPSLIGKIQRVNDGAGTATFYGTMIAVPG